MNPFGGNWTQTKLAALKDYLAAFLTIFHGNRYANWFQFTYVDAFAGSGTYSPRTKEDEEETLFGEEEQEQVYGLFDGSAKIALELEPGFKKYIFIESNSKRLDSLRKLVNSKSRQPNVEFLSGDANTQLSNWIDQTDWSRTRAIVFLDPYGMEVRWELISKLAKTSGVDLLLLFPVGAVIRMLPRDGKIPSQWKLRLNQVFGDDSWSTEFFREPETPSLFDEVPSTTERNVSEEAIVNYINRRLASIFKGTAKNPVRLSNTKGFPLFYLFFAASNPKGAPTAVKIMESVFKKHGNG